MWCKKCHRETNSEICEICGTATDQDVPVLVFWCNNCKTPIIKQEDRIDKSICPLCGQETTYLCTDIRPVFPEERLLVEILMAKPFEYLNSTVWSTDNRYYIDGKAKILPSSIYKKCSVVQISELLEKYQKQNNYDFFNETIDKFVKANEERLCYIFDEATEFIRDTAKDYPIFLWKDIDIWLYLLGEKVDFNDAYRLGYARVGCWCCPNNNERAQFLSQIYMPEQAKKWREFLIDFAVKIGKPDAEVYVYVDSGKWKARQGGNGIAAADDVKIRFTNCTTEEHAKVYRLNHPADDNFWELLTPFGKVSKELGRKLINETIVLDIKTNVPILSVQPFLQDGYDYAVKVKTMNVIKHVDLQRMVGYQVRKFNACRKCLKCESLCRFGAISIIGDEYRINESKCKHCKMCITAKYLDGGCMMDKYLKTKE